MDERRERQARNEAVVRDANERVAAMGAHASGAPLEIHCECGAFPACGGLVTIDPAAYEAVRAEDDRFVVLPGHENLELESVVERADAWVIVDKLPDLEPLVADDPRGRGSG